MRGAAVKSARRLGRFLCLNTPGRIYSSILFHWMAQPLNRALLHNLGFVHDLLRQPAFVAELHCADRGEPVSAAFVETLGRLFAEDPSIAFPPPPAAIPVARWYRVRCQYYIAIALGVFHRRVGRDSPLRALEGFDPTVFGSILQLVADRI